MDGVVKGKKLLPPRLVIHGKGGVGKSTFAAGAPRPIFLPTEDGVDEIGADRFPKFTEFAPFLQALGKLVKEPHDYETVVIDSGDWLERLIFADVCRDKGVRSLEDIPYGKGYGFALDRWRRVLDGLDLCRGLGMVSIVICHSQIKRFDSPESEPYDRWQLKLRDNAGALLSEWCDALLYATDDVVTKGTDTGFGGAIVRGVSTGKRSLRCVDRPAYTAKNRYGLPDSIPFPRDGAWDRFVEAIGKADSKESVKAIKENGKKERDDKQDKKQNDDDEQNDNNETESNNG